MREAITEEKWREMKKDSSYTRGTSIYVKPLTCYWGYVTEPDTL